MFDKFLHDERRLSGPPGPQRRRVALNQVLSDKRVVVVVRFELDQPQTELEGAKSECKAS